MVKGIKVPVYSKFILHILQDIRIVISRQEER